MNFLKFYQKIIFFCYGSNNVEDTNSPTLIVSQKRLVVIRRKKFFSHETSFKEQNREAHGTERIRPHITDRVLVCNNNAKKRSRSVLIFWSWSPPWLTVKLLGLYTLEFFLIGGLCCDSNNVKDTNSPTSVVSQRRFILIRRKKFFPREAPIALHRL